MNGGVDLSEDIDEEADEYDGLKLKLRLDSVVMVVFG